MKRFLRRRFVRSGAAGILLSVLVLAGAIVSGCGSADYRPRAVGQEGEIVIVIDSTDWSGSIGEAIKGTVGRYIKTLPAPERQFDLRQVDLVSERDLEMARRHKNVIFVASLSDSTNEARYMKNVFDSTAQQAIREGGGTAISRENIFRRDQQVYYITGVDTDDVVDVIESRSDELSRAFNTITRRRLEADMFDRGRQHEIEDYLMEEHGFAVNVQHDYQVAIDTTNFIWLRRILPETWRSLFIYYVDNADPAQLDPEWVLATRDSLTREHVQGNLGGWVEVDRRDIQPLESENIGFLGRYGFETRGLWQMVGLEGGELIQFGMGGPFLNYSFYDRETGRLYMIDGMVFAPGYNKREFLRQLEVIAHTFRTREEAQPAVARSE
ncbi:MAG: DUF4837 family protein [Rhodothermales bacterium]